MKNFLEKVFTTVFATNEKKELKQNVRNDFKRDFVIALRSALTDLGLETEMVSDGIAVIIPNDTEGKLVVVVDGAVKSLNYDLYSESKAYTEKVESDRLKAIAKAEAKAKTIAEAEANKLKKNAK